MIASLIHLIKFDLGYQLHRSVQKLKTELSASEASTFAFSDGTLDLRAPVTREAFEGWIDEELGQVAACVDGLLAASGVVPTDVDAVFLTGGTAYVPAVRRLFETRFGVSKIRGGHEFTSVAVGLARRSAAG